MEISLHPDRPYRASSQNTPSPPISNIQVTYYATKPKCSDLSNTCAHNMYSRTIISLEENLTIANKS